MKCPDRIMGLLRSVFGSSKHEIWEQIAKEIGGKYEDSFWGGDTLRVRSGKWKIITDTYSVGGYDYSTPITTYTRITARFLSKDGLYFKVYRKGFYSSIGKFFGMQDIEIGDPKFDNNFIIKGNMKEKVKLLLQDTKLKQLIDAQPDICFRIRRTYKDVYELYFKCEREIDEKSQLKNLLELFSLTLERLVQIDSAYDRYPER